ncbi:MAG: T9SS type A sorting domain-containing protein [Paludibacter sp.]|nr:T9SS type A sorting domain-containing protein [Paludibacter sp.]
MKKLFLLLVMFAALANAQAEEGQANSLQYPFDGCYLGEPGPTQGTAVYPVTAKFRMDGWSNTIIYEDATGFTLDGTTKDVVVNWVSNPGNNDLRISITCKYTYSGIDLDPTEAPAPAEEWIPGIGNNASGTYDLLTANKIVQLLDEHPDAVITVTKITLDNFGAQNVDYQLSSATVGGQAVTALKSGGWPVTKFYSGEFTLINEGNQAFWIDRFEIPDDFKGKYVRLDLAEATSDNWGFNLAFSKLKEGEIDQYDNVDGGWSDLYNAYREIGNSYYYQIPAEAEYMNPQLWKNSADDTKIIKVAGFFLTDQIDIVLDEDTEFTGSENFGHITVNAGKKLTVANGATLNAGTLLLKSDATGAATLINNGTLNVPEGNQIYSFTTPADNRNSWYVGSPVSAAPYTALQTFSEDETKNPFKYIEANDNGENDGWEEVTDNLTAGVGYNVYLNPSTTYSLSGGTFNDGAVISLPLTYTLTNTDYKGFNFIANPYPAYLNLTGLNFANIETTIWKRTWDGSDMFYETQNYASGEGVPAAAGNIAPMQGFWVRATAATTTLTLTSSMREHKGESGALRINSNRSRLRLNIGNGSKTDQMLVYFDNNASNAFDNFDSRKLSNDNAAIPEIYTVTGNTKLVINGMSAVTDNLEIPLGVKLGAAGQFTIAATEISNLAGYDIILKDNLLQSEINLSESDYPFASAAMDNTERFSIIFRAPTEINFVQSSKFKVQSLNGQIIINNARAGDKVEIFTTLGQKLYEQTLNSPFSTIHFPLHTGVYLVKSGNETVKVIVK